MISLSFASYPGCLFVQLHDLHLICLLYLSNFHFLIFCCLKLPCFEECFRFSCRCACVKSCHCCPQMDLTGAFERIAQAGCLASYLSLALLAFLEGSHSYSLHVYLDLFRVVKGFLSFFCFLSHLYLFFIYFIHRINLSFRFFFMILE